METKLLKILLKPRSKTRVKQLINYIKKNIDQPKFEMAQKGYFWDSVFYESDQENDYLLIVLKSSDFSNIMLDDSQLVETEFRAFYNQFRKDCWHPSGYKDLEVLACFNQAMEFGIN
ncbi:DUF6176 family protein [Pleionea sediminis]|uniref:DUF6176 family protein n=1 Tax=Pleionea sediminis TaxID=2569479 RepID=UPI001185B579|nr:DUF6176 family protein [Pleionea sediminis]